MFLAELLPELTPHCALVSLRIADSEDTIPTAVATLACLNCDNFARHGGVLRGVDKVKRELVMDALRGLFALDINQLIYGGLTLNHPWPFISETTGN